MGVLPKGHPLIAHPEPTLKMLAREPHVSLPLASGLRRLSTSERDSILLAAFTVSSHKSRSGRIAERIMVAYMVMKRFRSASGISSCAETERRPALPICLSVVPPLLAQYRSYLHGGRPCPGTYPANPRSAESRRSRSLKRRPPSPQLQSRGLPASHHSRRYRH